MRISFLHLALAAPAMSLLLPPTHEEKVLIAEKHQSNAVTADGKTTCPPRLLSMCCDSLDYSGFQVECVGPGKVDYLEKCLEYESRPMCCCMYPTKPDMPHVPREITCDKDCNALKGPEEVKDKVIGDL
ncbi:hypothetical protein SMACR_12730 [Sordaria macrospora]|uniref:WGS project CABT00000000 data, contig 2.2 n=2 Tax=Sordaria macrospora TaxID=5147 RepID=F7VNI7_SORMK|nr:uncharacterized protein SMAC_12730 [Sordaria macrospora k-hell]KAA8632721.1 hypothetical protein SMACR_12730 [Sordaria macrospora]KAH7630699.1 hypothetical protein B0T09DRAFT_338262 [Sordaria sp. MPI-SDFR-AT-0083]WPJ62184.1 hypothetical protein SMAC4_12730 [Sordaria macrospora]CCC06916.1 unnamed protein product [Sordaria macrospora k-hell]